MGAEGNTSSTERTIHDVFQMATAWYTIIDYQTDYDVFGTRVAIIDILTHCNSVFHKALEAVTHTYTIAAVVSGMARRTYV